MQARSDYKGAMTNGRFINQARDRLGERSDHGGTITGGTIRTAEPTEGETRVEITDAQTDRITWVLHSGGVDADVALIEMDGTEFGFSSDNILFEASGVATLSAGDVQVISSKLGFFGATPVTKRAAIADHGVLSGTASDGTARTKINQILQVLRDYGLIS